MQKIKNKNKYYFAFKIILLFFVFFAASIKIKAGTLDNTTGWIWGVSDDGAGNATGVGWISMNSLNCDANGDGKSDGTLSGCPASGTTIASYGVTIPSSNGDLSGNAWSPNIGWISFNRSDLSGCPNGSCAATRSGTSINGWARIMGMKQEGANAGGWSGWVSLTSSNCDANGDGKSDGATNCPSSGTSMASYGVTISGSNLIGYAWSDELGWIHFNGTNYNPVINPASSYLLTTTFNAGVTAGSATLSGGSISCTAPNAGTCSATFTPGATAAITATPQSGYSVTWVGCDSITGTASIPICNVTMNSNKTITANVTTPPTETLSSDKITIDVDSVSLPQSVKLTWSSSDASSCSAVSNPVISTWNGSVATSGSGLSQTISSSNTSESFSLSCTGPGGTTSTAPFTVTTVCNSASCVGPTCVSTPHYGVANSSDPLCAKACTDNSQCAANSGTWFEVAP